MPLGRCGHRPLRTPRKNTQSCGDGLNLHELLILLGAHFVDLLDVFIGELLNVLFGLLLVVFGQFALLLGLLDEVNSIAADITDGDLRVLAVLFDLLGELFSALLGQLREDEADDAAVVLRVDAEV